MKNPSPELAKEVERIAGECREKVFREDYVPALAQTYYRADFSAVAAQWGASGGKADLEALLAYSHNVAILAQMNEMRAQIQALYNDSMSRIEQLQTSEVEQSAAQRDQEVEMAREQHRRRMMAVAAGLQAMGQSMSQPQGYRPATSTVITPYAAGCSSDFDCSGGVGYVCVKQNFATTGYCATAVNSYGTQTFQAPRLNSVMPKMPVSTDCKGLMDCPPGFSCQVTSGTCVR